MDWGGLSVIFLCRFSSFISLLVVLLESPLLMASMLVSAWLSDASRLFWRGVRWDRRQLSSPLLSWMEIVREDG